MVNFGHQSPHEVIDIVRGGALRACHFCGLTLSHQRGAAPFPAIVRMTSRAWPAEPRRDWSIDYRQDARHVVTDFIEALASSFIAGDYLSVVTKPKREFRSVSAICADHVAWLKISNISRWIYPQGAVGDAAMVGYFLDPSHQCAIDVVS
jgi:hypothetical protein